MKNKSVLLAGLAAMMASGDSQTMTLTNPNVGYEATSVSYGTSPIYIPYYHTKQTYRSQARKAKNRRAAR